MACLVFKHEFLATLKARPTDDSSAAVVAGASESGGWGTGEDISPPPQVLTGLYENSSPSKGLGLLKVSRSRNMKQIIHEILTSPKIQTNGVILNNCID